MKMTDDDLGLSGILVCGSLMVGGGSDRGAVPGDPKIVRRWRGPVCCRRRTGVVGPFVSTTSVTQPNVSSARRRVGRSDSRDDSHPGGKGPVGPWRPATYIRKVNPTSGTSREI